MLSHNLSTDFTIIIFIYLAAVVIIIIIIIIIVITTIIIIPFFNIAIFKYLNITQSASNLN